MSGMNATKRNAETSSVPAIIPKFIQSWRKSAGKQPQNRTVHENPTGIVLTSSVWGLMRTTLPCAIKTPCVNDTTGIKTEGVGFEPTVVFTTSA